MKSECTQMIFSLHEFIGSWLKGSIEKNKDEYGYFENVLDEDFVIIHPSGQYQSKREIVNDFWNAHNVQTDDFKIEIKNINTRLVSNDLCIYNYEEWQFGQSETTRISTAVFTKSENRKHFSWTHLHETWVPHQ